MLPVNVDDEGNEENAVMWVLIDCSFSSGGWNEIMSNNGSMLIGIQEVQPFDFAINDGEVTYVLDKVRNNVPKFFVSELALSFAWTEPPSASKNFVFTINTCHPDRRQSGGCVELARLHGVVVKATELLLQGLQPSSYLMSIDDDLYHDCHSEIDEINDRYKCSDKSVPKVFDFMEIGTSGFGSILEICRDHHKGISIEPVGIYQDMLPNKPNVYKLRFAVYSKNGFLPLYQIPKAIVDSLGYNLDQNVPSADRNLYGMARLGGINRAQIDIARGNPEVDVLYLIHRDLVPVRTIRSIYMENNIHEIKVLKLDCEGADFDIIISAMDFFEKFHKIYPRIILLESNSIGEESKKKIAFALRDLQSKGYTTYRFFHHIKGTFDGADFQGGSCANSDTFAVHETSTPQDIDEYKYMFTDKNQGTQGQRGVDYAINVCQEVITRAENHFHRHCNILTYEGHGVDTDVVIANRCFHGSC